MPDCGNNYLHSSRFYSHDYYRYNHYLRASYLTCDLRIVSISLSLTLQSLLEKVINLRMGHKLSYKIKGGVKTWNNLNA